MEPHAPPKILVRREDQSTCGALSTIPCRLSTVAELAQSVAEPSGNGCYQIIIVDLQKLDEAGMALIERTISNCPYAKIIGIKAGGVQGRQEDFRLEFFRCFEKPPESDCLSCAVRHTLEIQAKEQIICEMAKELEALTHELTDQRLQFELLNQELLRNSDALSVLTENIQRERERVEKRVALNLRSIIIPSIDKLRKIKAMEPYSCELDLGLIRK